MTQRYVTLADIVAATKKTRQAIQKRAKGRKSRKGQQIEQPWSVHHTEEINGGNTLFYDAATLPKDIQAALNAKAKRDAMEQEHAIVKKVRADAAAEKTAQQAKGEANLKKLMEKMSPSGRARFEGRYEIVMSWRQFFDQTCPPDKKGDQKGKKKSYEAYVAAYNAGKIEIGAETRAVFKSIGMRSLQRWLKAYEKDGPAGLIDHMDGSWSKDVSVFTTQPALEKTAVALLIACPTIKKKHLTELLQKAAVDKETGEVLFEEPSYDATVRFVNAWKAKNAELYTAATNPDLWKNEYMVAFGDASEDVERLNQRWEMDATPADWMLQDDEGNLRRYTASVVIDVYSRRALVVLAPTPKTETHKLALRLAMLQWGVPEEIVTDNGKDYKSRDFVGTLDALKIAHHVTAPFSPWEKPHVERMNQTLLHSVLEAYTSFIGHNVAERSAIEARASFAERLFSKETKLVEMAMPAPLLQTRINQWLTGTYEQERHEGIGMSPFAKAAAYRGVARRIEDERALDVLLAQPAGKGSYVITKKGLRFEKAQFIAPELALIVRKTVQVRLTDDYGKLVVYHEGKFVCVACCPERTGVSRKEIAIHARKLQRQNVQEQRKAAKQTKVDPDALVSSLLQAKAEAAGKLVTLPAPAAAHRTAALKAAGQAARTLDGAIAVTEVPQELKTIMNKRQAERETAAAPAAQKIAVIPETPQLRFRKWLELDELLANGGTIDDPKLTRWYGTYPQHPEHAAMYKRHQDSLVAQGAHATAGTVTREFKTQQN